MLKYQTIALAIILQFAWLFSAHAGDRFTDNRDGTVTDQQLGVMWARTDNHGDIDWKQAQRWVKFTFPDTLQKKYGNWRLPTLKELQSLVVTDQSYQGYQTECGQWVKMAPQIKLTCGWVWTSERDPMAPTARIFNFNNVYHYTVRISQKRAYRALPVRDLE